MNKLSTLLFVLALGGAASASQAQTPIPALPHVHDDVPYTSRVFVDAELLKDVLQVQKVFPWLRNEYYTRLDFVHMLDRVLGRLQDDATAEARLRADPQAVAAFSRLMNEFEHELAYLTRRVNEPSRTRLEPQLRNRLAALMPNFWPGFVSDSFPDVPPTHWAFPAVEKLRREGIIIGYPQSGSNVRTFNRPRPSRQSAQNEQRPAE